jgi:hypothetical protein
VLENPKGRIEDSSPSQVKETVYFYLTFSKKNKWVLERNRCNVLALP